MGVWVGGVCACVHAYMHVFMCACVLGPVRLCMYVVYVLCVCTYTYSMYMYMYIRITVMPGLSDTVCSQNTCRITQVAG